MPVYLHILHYATPKMSGRVRAKLIYGSLIEKVCLGSSTATNLNSSQEGIWPIGGQQSGSGVASFVVGCCRRFGGDASLYRHRSQLFGRL